MKTLNDFREQLDANIIKAAKIFHEEISTDENMDYRRGFRAGMLYALLDIGSTMGSIEHVTPE